MPDESKTTLILFRHGERFIDEILGDGPLTELGCHQVIAATYYLEKELSSRGITIIDLAIVSGSIRASSTFGLVSKFLCHKRDANVHIYEYDMDKKYYGTDEEDILWKKFYLEMGGEFHRDKEKIGETAAYLKHAYDLINPCVCRTTLRINQAINEGCKTIMYVGHGPHDALIEESYTHVKPEAGLNLGECKIVTF